jgi:hypothetical protein
VELIHVDVNYLCSRQNCFAAYCFVIEVCNGDLCFAVSRLMWIVCVCLKYVVIITAIDKYQMNINALNTALLSMTETHAIAKCGRECVITHGRH